MKDRLDRLRANMAEAKCDAFVSLSPPANQYLTGFTGSTSAVLVTEDEAWFLCDFRYTEQAGQQVETYTIEECSNGLASELGKRLKALGMTSVVFDPAVMSVAERDQIESAFESTCNPVPDVVASLRRIKDAGEVERIRAAVRLAEDVLADGIEVLAEGMAERDAAAWFEYEFKKRGASGASFDTIALFGAHSSLVHGAPGDKPLEPGDMVLLDLGCRLDGYCSDLTRTYVYATIPAAWFEEIYDLTLTAQQLALEAARPGMGCRELDAVARDLIDEGGYGDRFGHGLGHGVGIEVHEAPRLHKTSNAILEEGMVVTVEPGIYLPERGGVRIEDLVVITKDGCEVLTSAPKELRVIGA